MPATHDERTTTLTHGAGRWTEIEDVENRIAEIVEALEVFEVLAERTTHPAALRKLNGLIETRRRRLIELRERRRKLRSEQ